MGIECEGRKREKGRDRPSPGDGKNESGSRMEKQEGRREKTDSY